MGAPADLPVRDADAAHGGQRAALRAAPRRTRPPASAQRAVRLRASPGGTPATAPPSPANGFHVGLVPGLELQLNRSLALDLSGHFDYFSVSEYDLSPVGRPPASSGTTWEARIGVRWHPDDGWPAGPAAAGSPHARATRGVSGGTWAGRRRKTSPSTGWPRDRTSTPATRTSPRSVRAAGGTT